MALKYVRSEPSRIRVKCENVCPCLLYLSKDGSNPSLVVKTLVPKHNYYRIFKNPRVFVQILAKLSIVSMACGSC